MRIQGRDRGPFVIIRNHRQTMLAATQLQSLEEYTLTPVSQPTYTRSHRRQSTKESSRKL